MKVEFVSRALSCSAVGYACTVRKRFDNDDYERCSK